MSRPGCTLTLSGEEALSLEVALHQYLDGFTVKTIDGAHPDSQLRRVLRMWNRLRNVSLGNAPEWRLDRLPARLE